MIPKPQSRASYSYGTTSAKRVFTYVLAMGAIVVAIWAVPILADPIVVGLAIWSLRGDKEAVQSLTLATLITSLSPVIYVGQPFLRLLVIFFAGAGVLNRLGPFRSRRVVGGSGLGVALVLLSPSVIFAAYPTLALGKLVAFVVGAFVFVAVFADRPGLDAGWVTTWMISTFWVVAIASSPLLVSELGYLVNGRGFQGVIRHPQKLAVFLAPYVVFFVLVWLSRARIPFARSAAVVSIVLLALTQGRGATVAALGGIGIAILVARVRRGTVAIDVRPALLAAVGVVGLLAVTFLAGFGSLVSDFVTKPRGAESSTFVLSTENRVEMARDSLDRFIDSPVVGHGIGVPATVAPDSVATVLGFPVSAPVEAGNIVTGLLEQAGLLGIAGVAWFVARWTKPVFATGPVVAIGLVVSALLTNISEATFTSFGGSGGFVWLMLGWAVVLASEIRCASGRPGLP